MPIDLMYGNSKSRTCVCASSWSTAYAFRERMAVKAGVGYAKYRERICNRDLLTGIMANPE